MNTKGGNKMMHPNFSKLILYIDNELPEDEKKEIEKHIASCNICKERIQYLSRIDNAIIDTAPQWIPENFISSLDLGKKKVKSFGFSLKKLALGFLAFAVLSLPIIGIMRVNYDENMNKEFSILVQEHESISIGEVMPIKW